MLSSRIIKDLAHRVGFDLCGITACRHLAMNEAKFHEWLANGYQSSLEYMERNSEKRFDPRILVEESKTAVVCAISYKNHASGGYPAEHRAKVASYACMVDYHTTIRNMLRQMAQELTALYPSLSGRAFVDTAPLAEKQLAVDAGLGWIGRQSLVVTPQFGTYILLGELILCEETDVYDKPFEGSRCGNCHNCVDSCPTGAIVQDKVINTGRCISCHTIEKEPPEGIDLHGWIFGCDCCQNCCPYNRRSPLHTNPALDPVFDPVAMTPEDWLRMTPEEFKSRLKQTPLSRSGLERIKGNVK